MQRALWISASGMEAQQFNTDVIANNMANVNTAGFKRSMAQFKDLLYQTIIGPGAATSDSTNPVGIQVGTGVRVTATAQDFSQGNLESTGTELDVAIEGEGMFKVTLSDGTEAYTRSGSFHRDAAGTVVDSHGNAISTFPTLDPTAEEVQIASDGTVSEYVNGVTTNKGQMSLFRFPNVEGLKAIGYGLFLATDASGSATTGTPGASGYGRLAQRYLEVSNVEIVKEMVKLIAAQRAYEINSKSIKTADSMLATVVNLK